VEFVPDVYWVVRFFVVGFDGGRAEEELDACSTAEAWSLVDGNTVVE